VINIYQSSLVGIVVSDHVKKFITPPHNNWWWERITYQCNWSSRCEYKILCQNN
jgi:hypothetical protein